MSAVRKLGSFSASNMAASLAISFHNGNRTYVLDQIDRLSHARATAVVSFLICNLNEYEASCLRKMLTERL